MTNNPEFESFLNEGLQRYADARQAVEVFEREIEDRLTAILEAKQDWQHFKGQRGARGRGKAFASGDWNDASGCGIWASQLAENASDGWIDLGLWWGSRKAPNGVVAFCGRWDAGYKVRSLQADPQPPVQYAQLGRNPRFYVILEPGARLATDLDKYAGLLLEEMDRALAHPANP